MDNEKTEQSETSGNIRIVLENKDGWTISSDTILPTTEDAIQRLDAGFISEDRLPNTTTSSTVIDTQEIFSTNTNKRALNDNLQETHCFMHNPQSKFTPDEVKINEIVISEQRRSSVAGG